MIKRLARSPGPPGGRPDPGVAVAVLTFRRPLGLARILPELVAQAENCGFPARVLVVDNDPAGSAAAFVSDWAGRGVTYLHEPRPGISAARNRALDAAADERVLVFIDDDEVPTAGWLDTLLAAWAEWECAAVAAPVVARFDRPLDPWLAASGAFERRRLATGTVVQGAATHNLLLDLDEVRRLGLRFDERLGLTGGEDTLFVHQLAHRGGVIRWCDEAEVIEPVAPERLTRRWVIRRSYRAGTTWSLMELTLAGGRTARAARRLSLTARGVVRVAQGAAAVAVGVVSRDVGRRARGTIRVCSYAGLVAGAAGLRLREYGRRPQTENTKLLV